MDLSLAGRASFIPSKFQTGVDKGVVCIIVKSHFYSRKYVLR